jgi:pimeloyl-ACP methyl ester carboxylesterase
MTALVQKTHAAIATRSFGAGAAGTLARRPHDAVAGLSYAAVRGLSGLALRGAGIVGGETVRGRRPLADTPGGTLALGALNGVVGDRLERHRSPLATEMELRQRGERVAIAPRELAVRFPEAGERVAVFVHGLCETDRTWWLGADREGGDNYGAMLRHDLGHTPLYVRYNSGRPISANARALSDLLDRVVQYWPVEVEEVVLVGHSMGGLVARCACHAGLVDDAAWVERVRHVFYLGSPHVGADLAKGAHVATSLLGVLPETRPFAEALDRRSAGIKDLRHRQQAPFVETATHYFIAATLTEDPSHPVGRLVGDLLVRLPSAWADGQHSEHRRFDLERSHSIGPLTHFDLLNHPAVYREMRRWVERSPDRRHGAARVDQ